MSEYLDIIKNKAAGRSVIIFTNPRTGSSTFCLEISKHLGIKNLQEFTNPVYKHTKKSLKRIPRFVIKHMIERTLPVWIKLDCCCTVKLYRRNLLDQITSHYIAGLTKTWARPRHIKLTQQVPEGKLNLKLLKDICNRAYIMQNKLDSIDAELTFYYEDLVDQFDSDRYVKPRNYDLIRTAICQRLTKWNLVK